MRLILPCVINPTLIGIQDAFYGPQYWSDYDPSNPSARSPASLVTIDTHQYYAFAPLNNLPHDTILDSVCNISQLLKLTDLGIPPTVVGEWSLETGTSSSVCASIRKTVR